MDNSSTTKHSAASDVLAEMQATKEFIEKVLSSLNDHFVMFDREWRYTYVNDAAARTLGLPKEKLLGNVIWELFPEAIGNQFYHELHRARDTGQDIHSEHYYQQWDAWFENHIYAQPDGVSVLSIDITARKKAQAAQERSDQMLDLALQAAEMVAWEWDVEQEMDQAPIPSGKLFGLPSTRTNEIGFEAVHPDDVVEYRRQVERAVVAGLPYHLEFRVIHPDGGEISWIEEWGFASPNPEGVIQKLFGVTMESTARKHSEQSLRESEARFRKLADSVPVMIWITNAEGRSIYLNQQWYDFTGGISGTDLDFERLKALHPEDVQRAEQTFLEAHRQRKPVRQEYRLCRHDGQYRWMIDSAMPRFDAEGAFLGYIGSMFDITDRKEAEERLQVIHQLSEAVNRAEAVEQIYELALSGLERVLHVDRASIMQFDRTGVMRFQAWRGLSAAYRAEVDGQSPRSINEANPVPVLIPNIAEANLGNQQQITYDEGIRAIGFIPLVEKKRLLGKFIMYYDQPHTFSEAEVQWAETIARHVAHALQRKQAEARLQTYTHTLEALNHVQLSLAAELDLQKVLQMVTDVSTELSGAQFGAFYFKAKEGSGQEHVLYALSGISHEAFEPLRASQATALFNATFQSAGVVRVADMSQDSRFGPSTDVECLPNAHIRVRSYLAVPVVSRADEVIGGLCLGHSKVNIFTEEAAQLVSGIASQAAITIENARLYTQIKERETALRELNATLEQRVEKRTEELQRSNRELDQFAYVASHDLKAPLRAISHLAGWIAQDAQDTLPAISKEHLEKLQARVRRMETLLDDLLAFSRAGRKRHPAEKVDISQLIRNVAEILAPPPGFTVKIDGELPVMSVERIPLETVFRNLIGNAIKHHHRPTEGTVEISAQEQDAFVEFTVRDDGPGIEPVFHQRIFEMFQTLQPRDQVEGSGVGLAIVKRLIESRGGSIQVESKLGDGAVFRFTWPKRVASFDNDF